MNKQMADQITLNMSYQVMSSADQLERQQVINDFMQSSRMYLCQSVSETYSADAVQAKVHEVGTN